MTYTPVLTVTVSGTRLEESTDLTKPVSNYVTKDSYLVVEKDYVRFVLSINTMLISERGVNLQTPVATAFNHLFTDLFVSRYKTARIPLLNSHGVYDNRIRVLNPISYKNYTTQFTSVNTPEVVDDVTRKGFLDDLVISSNESLKNALVAVNGVFHRTTLHDGKLYVLDGFRTCRITDRKDVCLVDTSPVGGHTTIPLTTSNVSLSTFNGLATVKTDVSLRNKTVMLVIDGYFYHIDTDTFFYGNDKTLKIRTNKLPLIEQFRHNPKTMMRIDLHGQDSPQGSRKYDDPYEKKFLGKRHVGISELKTRDFQLSRLTSYHSFLVVMNNPAVFHTSLDLLPTGTPQFYCEMSDRVLSGMMSYGVGLCPSYLIMKDPFGRKHVLFQNQDSDTDWQRETVSPAFVPSLIPDEKAGSTQPVRFVDYVSS